MKDKYTREQLVAAFDKVKDKNHWKNPIKSYCSCADVDIVAEAIEYFTATKAEFDYLGVVDGEHKMHVRAAGYYAGPAN